MTFRRLIAALFFACSIASPVIAADKVAIADTAFATAGTWATANATGTLISTSASTTALTTSTQDSATFTPNVITVNGFMVRLASRASGSPTNTMTVTLRNSTDAVNVQSCVFNVSDLAASNTTDDQGGWYYCHFSSNATLLNAKAYLIRAVLSATTTAVSLSTNGTTANWQHILVTTTTGAPAAGDDLHIAGWCDNATSPCTVVTRSITMDSTANTDYGSANTSYRQAALNISKGATLTWGIVASTNYILRLSGHLEIYSGGAMTIGTGASPVPISGSAELQSDTAADLGWGVHVRSGGSLTTSGSPNLSSNTNTMVRLNADAAAAATSLTTDATLSAKNGQDIAVSSTTTTTTQAETRAVNADCSASSCSFASGLANAHNGDSSKKAMVIALSRNVRIVGVTSTNASFVSCLAGATTCSFKWTEFRYMGQSTTPGLNLASDSPVVNYCSFRDSEGDIIYVGNGSGSTITTADLQHIVGYNNVGSGSGAIHQGSGSTVSGVTLNDINLMGTAGTQEGIVFGTSHTGAFCAQCDNLWVTGYSVGIEYSVASSVGMKSGVTLNTWEANSNTSGIIFGSTASQRWSGMVNISGVKVWANTTGLLLAGFLESQVTNLRADANGTGVSFGAGTSNRNIVFYDATICGNTTRGLGVTGGTRDTLFVHALFGSQGVTDCTTNLIDIQPSGTATYDITFESGKFDQTLTASIANTAHVAATTAPGSRFAFQFVTAFDRRYTDVYGYGIVEQNADNCTGGFSGNFSCVKLTPNTLSTTGSILRYLDTSGNTRGHGFLMPVEPASKYPMTVSATIYKSTNYNGTQPVLICRSAYSLGINNTDAVVDTATVGTDTYETLTASLGATSKSGVLECVVGVDGTAGSVWVSHWAYDTGIQYPPGDEVLFFNGYPWLPFYRVFPATIGRVQ